MTLSHHQPPLLRGLHEDNPRAPAIIMSKEYWLSQGFDTHTAYSMEAFQCQLVDRKFTYGHVICFEPATPNISIPHHDVLVQHWTKYMQNLLERGRAKSLFIERFELQYSSLNMIVPSVLKMHLSELGICNCRINANGLLLVAKALSQNHTLKRLLLNENQIDDIHVARTLSVAVKNHPTLQELCISHCGVGTNADVLPTILYGCSNLKTLRLNENNISSNNIAYIRYFIASNPSLTCLRLDKNLLSDTDATQLAAALTTNTNLQYLYLKGNDFTDEGKEELMKVVFDTTSLNAIATSNHNCEVVFNSKVLTSHINENPTWSRKRKIQSKILLALYGMTNETSVIQYFNDVPFELIPHALELIQKELDDGFFSIHNEPRQLLSRTFHFLRVWNVPWLFTNGVQPQ